MKHRITLSLAMIALVSLPIESMGQQPLSDLLEKGIYAEETKGDLEQAIQIYGQIVDNDPANRKIVAQAYYRLFHNSGNALSVSFQVFSTIRVTLLCFVFSLAIDS